jgi:uncharacterized protein
MKFSLDERADVYTIKAYGPGYVELSMPSYPRGDANPPSAEAARGKDRQMIHHSIVLLANQVQRWSPHSFSELEARHFQPLLELEPEVVIVGTGECSRLPPPHLIELLLGQQIGVEFMGTPAACRTYNILIGEGRRVVAALLMI